MLLIALQAPNSFADVLHDQDNGPLTGIFGVPDSTEGSFIVRDGFHAWSLTATTASHSIDDQNADESLLLDGETSRFEFRYRYGLTERFEVGLELPYVQHNPGRLDSTIDAWHDFFGLPAGDRPLQPLNELKFIYAEATGVPINVSQQSRGIGDARLFAGWQISRAENSATALRFSIKFPTGDSQNLHGSGGTDLSIVIAADSNALWGIDRLNGFYRAGGVYIGEPEFLADRARPLIGYLSSGLGYFVTQGFELRFQGAVRTAAYDSEVRNLGDTSVSLTFGGNIRMGEKYELSLAVGEDINVKSAPDVTFFVALRYRDD